MMVTTERPIPSSVAAAPPTIADAGDVAANASRRSGAKMRLLRAIISRSEPLRGRSVNTRHQPRHCERSDVSAEARRAKAEAIQESRRKTGLLVRQAKLA